MAKSVYISVPLIEPLYLLVIGFIHSSYSFSLFPRLQCLPLNVPCPSLWQGAGECERDLDGSAQVRQGQVEGCPGKLQLLSDVSQPKDAATCPHHDEPLELCLILIAHPVALSVRDVGRSTRSATSAKCSYAATR